MAVLGVVTGLKSEAKLLNGLGLACVSTGGQAREARRKIDRLIADGATGLVSFGIAGALSPALRTGDLVVADMVANDIGEVWQTHQPWLDGLLPAIEPLRNGRRPDDVPRHAAARRAEGHAASGPLWSSDGDLPEAIPAATRPSSVTSAVRPGPASGANGEGKGIRVGAILGLDSLLSAPRQKADAFARRGALAIDMESHHVARAAGEHGLPFIAVRAISDQAGEVLPAIMATFVDAEGQTKIGAVLMSLFSGRIAVGELLAAGRTSRRALKNLARVRSAMTQLV